jgi:hypothetical protein
MYLKRIGFLILFFVLKGFMGGAQVTVDTTFVMVGTYGSFTGSDSTFSGAVIFFSDQLGEGYFPTQIDSGFIAVDGLRNFYRVDSVWSQSISSANLRLIDLAPPYSAPIGTGQVYAPLSVDPYLIPPPPVNSTGVAPNYASVAHINNLSRMVSSFLEFSGLDTVAHDATLSGKGTEASPLIVSPSVYNDSISTIFNNSDFSSASTHFLLEDALGSWSTRFRSPSTNNYFAITSDTTDNNFVGLTWNTLGGNGKVGHESGGFYLEFGDDLYINSTNSLNRMYLTYTLDTDNTNTQAIAKDPITGELELVDLALNVTIDNIGVGDTLYYGLVSGLHKFKSILPGSYTTITPADSTITIDSEPPLSQATQRLISDRLVSGAGSYDLRFDSIPLLEVVSDEFFLSEDTTTVTTLISSTNKYLKRNAGVFRVNSLGLDYTILQNTNGTDELHGVYAQEDRISVISTDKEISGVNSNNTNGIFTPDDIDLIVKDTLGLTRGRVFMNRDYISIVPDDSLLIELDGVFDESLTTVMAIDTVTNRVHLKTVNTGSVSYETFTSGSVTTNVSRIGGTSTVVTNPSTGVYTYTVAANTHILEIDFLGTSANIAPGGTLTLNIDNSANSRDRYFTVQILQRTSNGQVDEEGTGTVYTQSSSANLTTISIDNLSGFDPAGYRLMLR